MSNITFHRRHMTAVPTDLLLDEELQDISNDAKVLYALLLDRASISRQNGYIDPDGTIRLYFTVEQVQKKLHRSRQCATRIFRELEYSGLIIRKKQGLGKPAVITLNYPADARLIMKEDDANVERDQKDETHRAKTGRRAVPPHTQASPPRLAAGQALLQQYRWRLPPAG